MATNLTSYFNRKKSRQAPSKVGSTEFVENNPKQIDLSNIRNVVITPTPTVTPTPTPTPTSTPTLTPTPTATFTPTPTPITYLLLAENEDPILAENGNNLEKQY